MRCFLLCFVVCLSAGALAQNTAPAPDVLLEAGHCLAAAKGDWLAVGPENPYALELGTADGGAGGDALYLVEFTTPTHAEGYAFAFETRGKGSHRELTLQFRTRFRQTVDGTGRVQLVDPPLGGVGTQEGVVGAIQQVGFHTWNVPVAQLRSYAGGVHCTTADAVR